MTTHIEIAVPTAAGPVAYHKKLDYDYEETPLTGDRICVSLPLVRRLPSELLTGRPAYQSEGRTLLINAEVMGRLWFQGGVTLLCVPPAPLDPESDAALITYLQEILIHAEFTEIHADKQ